MMKTKLRRVGDREKKIRFPWNVKLQLQETCALTPDVKEDSVATVIYNLGQQMHKILTIKSAS